MSDTVTKWHEMQEENSSQHVVKTPQISESVRKQAYRILVEFHEEAIREANNILNKLDK